jgi:hypothetical protein
VWRGSGVACPRMSPGGVEGRSPKAGASSPVRSARVHVRSESVRWHGRGSIHGTSVGAAPWAQETLNVRAGIRFLSGEEGIGPHPAPFATVSARGYDGSMGAVPHRGGDGSPARTRTSRPAPSSVSSSRRAPRKAPVYQSAASQSAMPMLNFDTNRAGRGSSASRTRSREACPGRAAQGVRAQATSPPARPRRSP